MWIELEDGRMLNAESITDVLFREHGKNAGTALAYRAGVVISGESKAIYDYFKSIQDGPLTYHAPVDPPVEPDAPQEPDTVQE